MLGKALEGLVLGRIKTKVDRNLSENQYGFRKGTSTEDVIIRFRKFQEECTENYVMGIFLDISRAFNNLWWPDIVEAVRRIGCSGPLVSLIRDYLRQRIVVFRTENGTVRRETNKGCPQESLLGPVLWNLIFDDLLRKIERAGFNVVAYADDAVIMVKGKTRLELEEKGQHIINLIDDWCYEHKMSLSPKKTVIMMLRGSLDMRRPPLIYLKGNPLKKVTEFRYLGVILESGVMGLKIGKHVAYVASKCKRLFYSLKRIAKRDWGIKYRALRNIYQGLFV